MDRRGKRRLCTKLQATHKQVYDNLVKNTSKYKLATDKKRRNVEFEVGDFVWVVLTKDRFPVREYNKPITKKIGPLEVLEEINSNAYRLKVLCHIRTVDVFNVKHLMPYFEESSSEDTDCTSRSTSLHLEGDDMAVVAAMDYLERMELHNIGGASFHQISLLV
ncbi:hypothetical protein Dsin_000282 [Dipteronia sinensis]|uniref:Tf2-1-like SH3-like domain-containing protein n=1 Tax=Dipteronia sinensis TaxID=43782 RepID=A0AAE0B1N6_9ROSI|nr:hypothetical protein Dsin_000282 [Dipteronia sinensis]